MEIITATDLYFDGTWEYAVVARSFATYTHKLLMLFIPY